MIHPERCESWLKNILIDLKYVTRHFLLFLPKYFLVVVVIIENIIKKLETI